MSTQIYKVANTTSVVATVAAAPPGLCPLLSISLSVPVLFAVRLTVGTAVCATVGAKVALGSVGLWVIGAVLGLWLVDDVLGDSVGLMVGLTPVGWAVLAPSLDGANVVGDEVLESEQYVLFKPLLPMRGEF